MDETIYCEIINQEKSSYRIELFKTPNGKYFVSIEQKIFSLAKETTSEIKIREASLDGLVNILKEIQSKIPKIPPQRGMLSSARKAELVYRYLNKNLEIETLAFQFNCTVRQVKQLLFEENLFVTSNKMPTKRFRRRRKKKDGK